MNRLEMGEAFICVVDTGSFTRAAKRLRLTPAAVSKRISKLEKHLSTRLLKRSPQGIEVTESGQHYYEQMKKLVEELDTIEKTLVRSDQEVKGTIKVVANRFYFQRVIIPRLPNFLEKYPLVKVEFDCSEVLPDFSEKEMDVLLGVSLPSIQENVMRVKIGSTRYVLCGSMEYFDREGIPLKPIDLKKHAFLLHGSRSQVDKITLDNALPVKVNRMIVINDTELLIQAALQGLGLIWTHENLVMNLIEEKKLVTVMNKFLKESFSIFMYYPTNRAKSSVVKAFVEYFKKYELSAM